MQEWEKETNPVKKKNLARQIQTMVGVKADGVIGRQTMQAIQQAGGGQPWNACWWWTTWNACNARWWR